MIISINQPAYLPWPGYFHRINCSDIFVLLDHVQFEKNSFINRNKIKTAQGWQWLTIPVKTSGQFGQLAINKLEIDDTKNWRDEHLKAIIFNYKKTPFFTNYFPFLQKIYRKNWKLLNDLNYEMLNYFLDKLGIKTKVVKSSELNVIQKKDKLVLELCKLLGAKTYFSGILGKDYLNTNDFCRKGVKVFFQNYLSPEYPQHFEGFLPNLSTLDLIFNKGPESLKIIMSGNITKETIQQYEQQNLNCCRPSRR